MKLEDLSNEIVYKDMDFNYYVGSLKFIGAEDLKT